MSYYIGFVLSNISNGMLDELRLTHNIRLEIESSASLDKALNKDEHLYYYTLFCSVHGISRYDMCKEIEEIKDNIEEKDEEYRNFFLRDIYPSIEIRKKDAAKWVDTIHTFFDVCGIKRMGILMYWMSNHIDECDFTVFPNDTTHLSDVTADVIMKFKPEVIHYIIA